MVSRGTDSWRITDISDVLQFLVVAVTLIVVAIPEGLPIAITIAFTYAVQQMMKDHNFVRTLSSCETMGGVTCICSDKTGTLTMNQMQVTEGWMFDTTITSHDSFPLIQSCRDLLAESIAMNTSASIQNDKVIGSSTEGALLHFLKDRLSASYEQLRAQYQVKKLFTFSSVHKRMTSVVGHGDFDRVFVKGAAEMIVQLCSSYVAADGTLKDITNRSAFQQQIEAYASKSLRTLCLAYKDVNVCHDNPREEMESNLNLLCILGIQDPLRPEAKNAVRQCKDSGILVKMVTGDNVITASQIARECGILDDQGLVMEGPAFRNMPDTELLAIVDSIQVLARSLPTDKLKLVKLLHERKHTVAVTGDGTNDSLALVSISTFVNALYRKKLILD